MTHEVIEAVENGIRTIAGDFNAKIDRLEKKFTNEMDELARGREVAHGSHRADPLAKLSDDAGVKAMVAGTAKSAIVKLDGGIDTLRKSTVVGDIESSNEDLLSVPAQHYGVIGNMQRRPLGLLDFLPRLPVTSNSFEFNRLSGYSNAAGYQATEGALKPEASMPTDLATANIATIAHWIGVSEQVLADSPALLAQLRDLMRYGVLQKLEAEIVAGVGGTGKIAGLTHASNHTAFTAGSSNDTLADAIAKAAELLDIAGWRAGLAIVHPTDWRIARVERADAGTGPYLAGSWRDPAPPSVWGVPVVTSTAVTAGNFIVCDPSQVLVLDRMQATVELGRTSDNFVRNVITARAELRASLAVLSPSAVLAGDFEP